MKYEVKKELTIQMCGKKDCYYCQRVKDNDGKVREEALIKLGLAKKAT